MTDTEDELHSGILEVFSSYGERPFDLFINPDHKAHVSVDQTVTRKPPSQVQHMMCIVNAPSADRMETLARQNAMDFFLSSEETYALLQDFLKVDSVWRIFNKLRSDELTEQQTSDLLDAFESNTKKVLDAIKKLEYVQHPFFSSMANDLLKASAVLEECTVSKFKEAFLVSDQSYFRDVTSGLDFLTIQYLVPIVALCDARDLFLSDEFARVNFVDKFEKENYIDGWNLMRSLRGNGNVDLLQIRNNSIPPTPVAILNGANQSGKSFQIEQMLYLRMVGQAFGYAPASSADLMVRDGFWYIERGTTDARNNLSAHAKDHVRWSNALSNIGMSTLIIGDEPFSATSPEDQVKLLYGAAAYAAEQGAHLVIATHSEGFIETVQREPKGRYAFWHLSTQIEEGKEPKYLHRLQEGVDSAHALELARALDIDRRFISLIEGVMRGEMFPASSDPREFPAIPIPAQDNLGEAQFPEATMRCLLPYGHEFRVKANTHDPNDLQIHQVQESRYRNGGVILPPLYFEPRGESDLFRRSGVGVLELALYLSSSSDPEIVLERQHFYSELLRSGLLDKISRVRLSAWRGLRYSYGKYDAMDLTPDFHKTFVAKVAEKALEVSSSSPQHPNMISDAIKMCCELAQVDPEDIGIANNLLLLEQLNEIYIEHIELDREGRRVVELRDKSQEWVDAQDAWYEQTRERRLATHNKLIAVAESVGYTVEDVSIYDFREKVIKKLAKRIKKSISEIDLVQSLQGEEADRMHEILDRYAHRYIDLEEGMSDLEGKHYTDQGSTDRALAFAAFYSPKLPHEDLCELLRQLDSIYAQQVADYLERLSVVGFQGFDSLRQATLKMITENKSMHSLRTNSDPIYTELNGFSIVVAVAKTIIEEECCKVDFNSSGVIEIVQGYNPRSEIEDEVANTILFGIDSNRLKMLTGTNGSGKSNELGKIISILMRAQSIGYVPAEYASLPIFANLVYFDRPTTFGEVDLGSLGKDLKSWDRLFERMSTREGPTFIAVDEAFSTTTPQMQEVFIVAAGIMLMQLKAAAAITTHNHQAVDILNDLMPDLVSLVHLLTHIDGEGKIQYDHRLEEGHEPSRGIDASEALGGMPGRVLELARSAPSLNLN